MRFVSLIFLGLIAAAFLVRPHPSQRITLSNPTPTPFTAPDSNRSPSLPVAQISSFGYLRQGPPTRPTTRADSVVAFGLAQLGTSYRYAGISPLTGVDCSGFIKYTFAHLGVFVPHSTALLVSAGSHVARADAQPGDIVVFTGTAPGSTTPGHAGIVVSRRGERPLRFVHASSARRESGVKVSQVENSGYEGRFMQVRRVL